MLLDPAPFAAVTVPDGAPSRTDLAIAVGGRKVMANIATKGLRKALATVAEHGADGSVLLLQGVLSAGDVVDEAGLTAQPKVKPTVQEPVAAEALDRQSPKVGGLSHSLRSLTASNRVAKRDTVCGRVRAGPARASGASRQFGGRSLLLGRRKD